MDESIKNDRKNIAKKLKDLHSTNPKDYWKILNRSDKNKKCAVDINDMYNFLKDMNEDNNYNGAPHNLDEQEDVTNFSNDFSDDILNCAISDEEILKSVKKLKNNKACGFDKVFNEHITSTITIFLPVYRKLFNLVFDSGTVPD